MKPPHGVCCYAMAEMRVPFLFLRSSLLFMILGYVLIQIQIRLEEEFLTEQHGEKYLTYKEKVRRLI